MAGGPTAWIQTCLGYGIHHANGYRHLAQAPDSRSRCDPERDRARSAQLMETVASLLVFVLLRSSWVPLIPPFNGVGLPDNDGGHHHPGLEFGFLVSPRALSTRSFRRFTLGG